VRYSCLQATRRSNRLEQLKSSLIGYRVPEHDGVFPIIRTNLKTRVVVPPPEAPGNMPNLSDGARGQSPIGAPHIAQLECITIAGHCNRVTEFECKVAAGSHENEGAKEQPCLTKAAPLLHHPRAKNKENTQRETR